MLSLRDGFRGQAGRPPVRRGLKRSTLATTGIRRPRDSARLTLRPGPRRIPCPAPMTEPILNHEHTPPAARDLSAASSGSALRVGVAAAVPDWPTMAAR